MGVSKTIATPAQNLDEITLCDERHLNSDEGLNENSDRNKIHKKTMIYNNKKEAAFSDSLLVFRIFGVAGIAFWWGWIGGGRIGWRSIKLFYRIHTYALLGLVLFYQIDD